MTKFKGVFLILMLCAFALPTQAALNIGGQTAYQYNGNQANLVGSTN